VDFNDLRLVKISLGGSSGLGRHGRMDKTVNESILEQLL
jgi:hypothetical protein